MIVFVWILLMLKYSKRHIGYKIVRLKYCADTLIEKLLIIKDDRPREQNPFKHYDKIRALLESNLLLLGYALENLIKGYLIFRFLKEHKIPRHSDLEFLEKHVWRTKKSHDLILLSQKAKLKLSDSEKDLLKKLTKYTTWKGRYHIPKSSNDIAENIRPGIGDTHTSMDGKIVEGLIINIKKEMEK